MELILRENKEITNGALNENLKRAFEMYTKAEDNLKGVALYLGTIMIDELYKDDFKSVKDFANYLSVSTAKLTQFARYAKITTKGICGDMFDSMSVTQILECARLIEYLEEMGLNNESIDIEIRKFIKPDMTCKEIREEVNRVLSLSVIEETKDAEDTENTEDTEDMKDSEDTEDAEEQKKRELKDCMINYLLSLEEGFEIDKEDVKMFKQIAKLLK